MNASVGNVYLAGSLGQQKKQPGISCFCVPSAGIEPAHLAVLEFESSASTNSASWAKSVCKYKTKIKCKKKKVQFNWSEFNDLPIVRQMDVIW